MFVCCFESVSETWLTMSGMDALSLRLCLPERLPSRGVSVPPGPTSFPTPLPEQSPSVPEIQQQARSNPRACFPLPVHLSGRGRERRERQRIERRNVAGVILRAAAAADDDAGSVLDSLMLGQLCRTATPLTATDHGARHHVGQRATHVDSGAERKERGDNIKREQHGQSPPRLTNIPLVHPLSFPSLPSLFQVLTDLHS